MKKAFTLVEFIVSIAILLIIGAVGISQYKSSLGDARNTTRIGDISTAITFLKSQKLNTGSYPIPQNNFSIFSGSFALNKQGFLNENIFSIGIGKTIQDPLTKGYYMYSVLPSGGRFQIGASLEDNDEKNISGFQAYIPGDYENILGNIPSLLFATQTGGTFSSLSGSMILQKSKWNLPYDQTGKAISAGKKYDEIINESGIENKPYSGYKSCLEILEAGYNYGSGIYNISPNGKDKISVYCDMSSDGGGWTRYVKIKGNYNYNDAKNCVEGQTINNALLECFSPVPFSPQKLLIKYNNNSWIWNIASDYSGSEVQYNYKYPRSYFNAMIDTNMPSYERQWLGVGYNINGTYGREYAGIFNGGQYMNYSHRGNGTPPGARDVNALSGELYFK